MEPTSSTSDPLCGRILGDFVVTERIDAGGFGVVYRAEQRTLSRAAVIKVLHMRHQDQGRIVQRFTREAQVASRLDHPYAAHIYSFGAEPDGVLWIAMELVRGVSLESLLKTQGPLPLERFSPFFQRLCEVVHAVHELGIVHRDLKPANVMVLSRGGQLLPKLLDFGVAKDLMVAEASEPTIERPMTPVDGLESTITSTRLTVEGAAVGTPPYMAPELWLEGEVGPRSDVYALGVLAHRMLRGRYPFDARSEAEMRKSHLEAPVPSLGSEFPAAVDEVLHKAMAKSYAERFTTALELGQAFAQAARPADEPPPMPALEPPVRDTFLADAPQPIAEAVALLDAARSERALRAATVEIARTVARYVAVLALAARSKIGPGGGGDSQPVQQLLHRLRTEGLHSSSWVALACELVRPFGRAATAHPVPELVALFFDDDGKERDDPFSGPLSSDKQGTPTTAVALVSTLLRRVGFVTSYPFAVQRGDRAERWTGLRRPRRASTMIRQRLAPDRALLLDEAGEARLVLWPLVQVLSPTPRADPEVFLIEGPSRSGARLTALPAGFQHHDDELWDWFASVGVDLGAEATATGETQRAPYLGLASFAAQDAGVFFGRERESEIALNRLTTQPFLAVVGASGAGKSSFVAAGIIAALADTTSAIVVRPGPAPLATLEARLLREGVRADGLRAQVLRDPDTLRRLLDAHADELGRRLLLIVDQFEELFTLGADADERRAYAEALVRAAPDATSKLRVILTLRDDFLMRAQELVALRDAMSAGLQLLSTPSKDDLRRILVEPARRLGFAFEDERLPDEMVAEVAEEPGALPLLSFTALGLWEQRDRQFKQITRRAYTALGGVGGALARHAEDLLDAMSEAERAVVREAFRHLVTAEGTRAVLRRAELLDLLGRSATAESVLEKLIHARLAVAQDADGGIERIEIVHEALVQAWPRLVRWRHEDAEGARLRDQLRAAARQWSERGRPDGLLWRGDALTELMLWRSRHGQAATQAESAFVRASERQAQRARRLRRALVGSAFVILSVGLVAVGTLGQRARHSAAEARDRVLELYEEQARGLVLTDEPQRALAYLAEAWRGGRRSSGVQGLIATALDAVAPQQRTYGKHAGRLVDAQLTPDDKLLVTAGEDGFVKIWDRSDGHLVREIEGLGGPVVGIDLDGDQLLIGSEVGRIGVWNIRDGHRLRTIDPHAGPAALVQVTADHRLAIQSTREAVYVWSPRDGRELHRIHDGQAFRFARLSPDGHSFATSPENGPIEIFSTATGERVRALAESERLVAGMVWSDDGARLGVSTEDGGLSIYSVTTGKLEHRLIGHTDVVRALRFSADGKHLASGSQDRTARLWNVADGTLASTLTGHRGAVVGVRFDESQARVITASGDGKIRAWERNGGRLLVTLPGHIGPSSLGPTKGESLVSYGADGTAREWRLDRGPLRRVLGPHGATVRVLQVAADGHTIAAEAADQPFRFWDLDTGTLRRAVDAKPGPTGATYASDDFSAFGVIRTANDISIIDEHGKELRTLSGHTAPIESACFTPDGSELITGSQAHELFGWDVRSGAIRWSQKTAADTPVWCAVSPDGKLVATANSDNTAELRDRRTGALLFTLRGHQGILPHVAFDARSKRLITSSLDKSAKVWDVTTGQLIASLDDHPDQVWGATFLGDDPRVATACLDGIVRLWDVHAARVVAAYAGHRGEVGSSRVDLQACKLEYSIVSPK